MTIMTSHKENEESRRLRRNFCQKRGLLHGYAPVREQPCVTFNRLIPIGD